MPAFVSMETEPRLGNPITSPQRRCGVAWCDNPESTVIRPRESASKPPAQDSIPRRCLDGPRHRERSPETFFLLLRFATTRCSGSFFDAFDFLVQPQGDATVPQVVAKRFDHFGVSGIPASAGAFLSA